MDDTALLDRPLHGRGHQSATLSQGFKIQSRSQLLRCGNGGAAGASTKQRPHRYEGGADSAPSPFSSWTIVGGGEVALGGLSLKESPPRGDAAGRVETLAAFLLLKDTTPSESSSSERISKTLFPLSKGVGAGDEATTRGTAAMGGGESGV